MQFDRITAGQRRFLEIEAARISAAAARAELAAAALALQPAGTCDGCGFEAVELAQWREDDEIGGPGHPMSYCRPCMGDSDDDPSLEWVTGEAI